MEIKITESEVKGPISIKYQLEIVKIRKLDSEQKEKSSRSVEW